QRYLAKSPPSTGTMERAHRPTRRAILHAYSDKYAYVDANTNRYCYTRSADKHGYRYADRDGHLHTHSADKHAQQHTNRYALSNRHRRQRVPGQPKDALHARVGRAL